MIRHRFTFAVLALLFVATNALASWYDDYDAGVAAARKGQWSVVADKMSKAIAGNPNESNKARTYGAIFINYHPFYYRGIANLNLGRYEQAVSDLERASGPGELDLGRIEDMIQRAKSKLEADSTPAPEPPPTKPPVSQQPPVSQPPVQTGPSIDPALRQRAQATINNATQRISAAQQRNATGAREYQEAVKSLADARTRAASARNNNDLEQAIAIADNAAMYADSAAAPVVASVTPVKPLQTTPTRPSAAADAVLADYKVALRTALESYFSGDFETATKRFEQLTRKMPDNGWLWAFLGASQYSLGAFELNEQYKREAMNSFRKAKQYRTWKGGLPDKYFSKRIRRVFEGAS